MARTATTRPTAAAPTPTILPLTSAAALVVWAAATPVLEDPGEVIVAVESTPEAAAPLIVAVVPTVEAELRAEAQMALPAERTLAASSAEHDFSMHGVTEAVILSLPVVHWQTVSLVEQPEAWTAAAKQAREHDGKPLTS